jgi:Fe-S oxidoreductase
MVFATDSAKCGRCAFCVAGCPVYAATLRQGLSPRSKLFFLDQIDEGHLEWSGDLASAFYLCTHCGQCVASCPSKVPILDRVRQAREQSRQAGLQPGGLTKAVKAIAHSGNPFAEPRTKRLDGPEKEPVDATDARTLYWSGCMAGFQDVRIVPAAHKVFAALGEPVDTLGQAEDCCGYLAWLAGDTASFQAQIEKNAARLSKGGWERLVTTCAGCQVALSRLYPAAGADIPQAVPLSVWLDDALNTAMLKFKDDAPPMTVIYHDPCDLGRHLGVYEPPRRVINALPRVELKEFEANRGSAVCCGGGGGLKAVHPDLSLDLAEQRAVEAVEKEVDAIVSSCPSCKQNFNQALARLRKKGRLKRRIKVMDVVELVAARLG